MTSGIENNISRRSGSKVERDGSPGERKRREPTRSVGVSLTQGEWARIEELASELRVKRGALLAYAVRLFIKLYDTGELTETSKVLKKL